MQQKASRVSRVGIGRDLFLAENQNGFGRREPLVGGLPICTRPVSRARWRAAGLGTRGRQDGGAHDDAGTHWFSAVPPE